MISWDDTLACIKCGLGHEHPKVSIVHLVYDFGKQAFISTLLKSVNSIRATAPADSDIIIVANGVSQALDAALKNIEQSDKRVTVISMRRNLGCVAKNFGYNLAQGDYICSVDGDVIAEPGWVEKFTTALEKDPTVGLVGPCGVRMNADIWTAERWGGPNLPGYGFGYEDIEFFGAQTASGKDGVLLDSIPSMCWCFRRVCLAKIGYLDWRFGPLVGSDADYCFRVKAAGWKLQIVRVPIHHVDGGGGNQRAKDPSVVSLRIEHIRRLYDEWYPQRERTLYSFLGW